MRTCAALLVPSLLPPTIFTTPFVQFSQASAQVVGDVLRKLLVVGITDPGEGGGRGRGRGEGGRRERWEEALYRGRGKEVD